MNTRRFMIILNSNLLLNSIATIGASRIYRLQPIGAFYGCGDDFRSASK